jgi:hypothetical protein
LGHLAYTNAKVRENYSRRFSIRFPNEELPAARPLRTTPIYEKLQAANAVFGDYCGLEHPLWFAPTAAEAEDHVSFRRSNAHPHVGAECAAVRDGVGMTEIANYGKIEVEGPGAAEWLSQGDGQQGARGRPYRADAHAQRARQADRRFHHVPYRRGAFLLGRHVRRRDLLHALVRAALAAHRGHGTALRHAVCGPVGGGTEVPGVAANLVRDDLSTGVSLHVFQAHGSRHGAGLCGASILHRGPGLRDVGDHGYQRALV